MEVHDAYAFIVVAHAWCAGWWIGEWCKVAACIVVMGTLGLVGDDSGWRASGIAGRVAWYAVAGEVCGDGSGVMGGCTGSGAACAGNVDTQAVWCESCCAMRRRVSDGTR